MAEERKRPKRPQVLIDPEMYRKIGVVAAWLDVSIPDWVNNALAPLVDQAFAQAAAQIAAAEARTRRPKK
jgi:hypothetical protein